MFLDPQDFPFLAPLQTSWLKLRAEYEAMAQRARPLPVAIHNGGWDVVLLYQWGEVIERAPETLAATDFPQRRRLAFSALHAGGTITPHTDDCNCLVAHLTLLPSPDTAIRVGSETRAFVPGELLVFDERVEHEVWNRGDKTRVTVLLGFDPENRAVRESEQAISSHFKKWWFK